MEDKYVLILGNGLSRLDYRIKKFIKKWPFEIWVSNGAYQEALELPNINKINGHIECIREAYDFKIRYDLNYECCSVDGKQNGYAKNIWIGVPLTLIPSLGGKIYDSGITWVLGAILGGYTKIYCAGFDLKGKDIYTTSYYIEHFDLKFSIDNMPKEMDYSKPKPVWLRRWRMINEKFGLDKIIFLGKDHKKFIRGKEKNF